MMDRPRALSLIVTVLKAFSAPDIYIVVNSHGREADVASGRPQAGQELVRERRTVVGSLIGQDPRRGP